MKYGYIKNDNIFEIITVANNGEWQSGAIERRSDGERLTAQEMIAKHKLKPIITPQDFNGNYGDYNFAETETGIRIEYMTFEAIQQLRTNKLTRLRNLRERECFAYVNRGPSWYKKIVNTKAKQEAFDTWYQQWLDVTETRVIPEKLSWLNE